MVYGQLAAAGLREGKRVAEGGDRFAELVLDFGFGILALQVVVWVNSEQESAFQALLAGEMSVSADMQTGYA